MKIKPYLLNLAGEYRVCSELNKRGIFATVTYGSHKGVDVYAISDRQERALRIEVKTSQRSRFVTSISQKGLVSDPTAPDFWVLFQLKRLDGGHFLQNPAGLVNDLEGERSMPDGKVRVRVFVI